MEYLCTLDITTKDKLSNINFITSLKDLYLVVTDNKSRHRVLIRKDFSDTYFPYNQLYEFIDNASRINPQLIIEPDDFVLNEMIDSSIIDTLEKNLTKDDLMLLLQFKSHDFIETLYKLIVSYKENKKFELEGASIISSLRESIDTLNDKCTELDFLLKEEIKNKADVQNNLSVLVNRINFTHNVGVNEDMLFSINSNNYDKVIYIKEITRVQYVDTLISVLQEVLRIVYNMPARIVTIEGYHSNGKVELYPDLKPHYCLTEKDVLSGDILMLGYQPKLFKDIMRNPSNISILIVLDRGGYKSPHLFGENVQYLFTVSDIRDISKDIPMSRIISYSNDTLYIPHIKDFIKLSGVEKVQKYSSLSIMKQVISLIE